ncbi:MAG: 2-oxo-4-hydroxy-4-carboxy-5-ureidoimidazoline decarboxylase [Acidiphilium sp.]|nr:2-oxo-4-hydroxy-4-carboxy-5-ureidoimidazoline decarboxylase [Acidiphilium sp.]MDD4936293.1 2-oxo-4-hydroxy-4-carboxy-5-ureidoimidazoline decarboxylase [Acidiphilium sp.]
MHSDDNNDVLAALNAATAAALVAWLGGAFEHSPWVIEVAAAARPFASVAALHRACVAAIAAAPEARRIALVRAHPDLAGKVARAGGLTPESALEQAGAGLDRLSSAQFARFEALNAGYRARFGWPFVICVRGRSAADILDAFECRMGGAPPTELDVALREIAAIAALRLTDLLAQHKSAPLAHHDSALSGASA